MLRLFLIFVKIGAILLGGGYVILPIIISEFVHKRNLVTEDEVINYFAISQSLPGIVAANISMFIGNKLYGLPGAICAVIGVTFVPFWLIVLFASALNILSGSHVVQTAMTGVSIAVIALILLTAREVWQKAERDAFFYIIFVLAFISLTIFKFSPIQVILFISILGLIIKKLCGASKA